MLCPKSPNPAHGSGRMVQVLSMGKTKQRSANPAKGSWRIFKSELFINNAEI
jgi:hypothetical protein